MFIETHSLLVLKYDERTCGKPIVELKYIAEKQRLLKITSLFLHHNSFLGLPAQYISEVFKAHLLYFWSQFGMKPLFRQLSADACFNQDHFVLRSFSVLHLKKWFNQI